MAKGSKEQETKEKTICKQNTQKFKFKIMQEEWKDVVGYSGLYEISNHGNLRSLPRYKKSKGGESYYTTKGKLLKPQPIGYKREYYGTRVTTESGEVSGVYYHILVAMAFLNHIPDGHNLIVDHIDNDQTNNRLDNLQIITQRENCVKDKPVKQNKFRSKYTGVQKCHNKFKARISCKRNGIYKSWYIGLYKTEYEAHLAYERELEKTKQG